MGPHLRTSKVGIHQPCEIFPKVGCPIRLIMHVRRFFCKKSTCAQKIFGSPTPRALSSLRGAAPHGCKKPSVSLDGRVGGQADAGSELGISGSRDTILRLVRLWKQSAQSEPRVIGVDDWAGIRRLRYGTLICE